MKVYAVWFSKAFAWRVDETRLIKTPEDVIKYRDCDKFMTGEEIDTHKTKIQAMAKYLKLSP